MKTLEQEHKSTHCYRVQVGMNSITFEPITKEPEIRNCHFIEVVTIKKWNAEQKEFVTSSVQGTLKYKGQDNIQRLKGFTARTRDDLLDKISKELLKPFAKAS